MHRLHDLKRLDRNTAQALMDEYPPPWDAEKGFRKTYRAFRQQSVPDAAPMEMSAAPEQPPRRIRQFAGFAAMAAMCGAIIAGLVYLSQLPPPEELRQQEIPQTDTSQTAHITEAATTETTVTDAPIPAVTPSETSTAAALQTSTETALSPTETLAAVTEAAVIPDVSDPSEESPAEEPPAVTQAAPVATPSPTTTPTPVPATTPAPAETTPAEVPPAPTEAEQDDPGASTPDPNAQTPTFSDEPGYFTVIEADATGYARLVYTRNEAVQEELAHDFPAEGFTVTSDVMRGTTRAVNFEDEEGQHYALEIIPFTENVFATLRFASQFDPDYYTQLQSTTVAGKPGFLLAPEDGEALCHLYWDDGCHMCIFTSQWKSIDNIIRLAESQT